MPSIIEQINVERILLTIHQYLVALPINATENSSDENGIRITKTIVNEFVKLKKNEIWNFYEGIESHPQEDTHIKRWIEIILKNADGSGDRSSITGGQGDSNNELDQILQDMKNSDMLHQDQLSKKLY